MTDRLLEAPDSSDRGGRLRPAPSRSLRQAGIHRGHCIFLRSAAMAGVIPSSSILLRVPPAPSLTIIVPFPLNICVSLPVGCDRPTMPPAGANRKQYGLDSIPFFPCRDLSGCLAAGGDSDGAQEA